jgi:hypothetical protein
MIAYLCLLFVGDGIKCQLRRINRYNMYEWKGIQEEAGEVYSTKSYIKK